MLTVTIDLTDAEEQAVLASLAQFTVPPGNPATYLANTFRQTVIAPIVERSKQVRTASRDRLIDKASAQDLATIDAVLAKYASL